MSFTGTYMQESQENYDGFMTALGYPEEIIEKYRDAKIKTEMVQNDTFRLTKELPTKTWTNTFTIGEKCQLEDVSDLKFTTTVILDGEKLKIQFLKYLYTAKVDGDTLTEVNTIANGPAWTKISKRI